jgi:hypothetical protein
MSLPSYQLSKNPAGVWICAGKMPSGRPFKFKAGRGGRGDADEIVKEEIESRLRSSQAARAMWQRKRAGLPGAAAAAPPPAQPPPPAAPAAPPPADIRAKLLGLGEARPIQPDAVFPDDGTARPETDEPETEPTDDEMDSEGQELIASLLAKGATLGIVALTNSRLRKRKPPEQGEPHEWGLKNFHDGIEHVAMQIVGRTATLGPTAKIFAGSLVIIGSMYMTAEPIDPPPPGAPRADPPPPPPAQPPVEHGAQVKNGTTTTSIARREPEGIPTGIFGVEKMTAN